MPEEKQLTANKGEWSEFYTFCHILRTGELCASDSYLRPLSATPIPILEIVRRDDPYGERVYKIQDNSVQLVKNHSLVKIIPAKEIDKVSKIVLRALLDDSRSRSFSIPGTEDFLKMIWIDRIKADTTHKEDIILRFQDLRSGLTPVMGFSIKSYIGGDPTLLNASEATNFRFMIESCNDELMEQVNSIETKNKITDRMATLLSSGCKFIYHGCVNEKFDRNLRILDGSMGEIIGEMLYRSYAKDKFNKLSEIVDEIEYDDPLKQDISEYYRFKVKKFLYHIALGLTPTADWKGEEGSNGGYIVVKENGEIVCFFLYDRSIFEDYLLNNTRFERGSTSRHRYATVHKKSDGTYYIDLNLQIRFTPVQRSKKLRPLARGQMTIG